MIFWSPKTTKKKDTKMGRNAHITLPCTPHSPEHFDHELHFDQVAGMFTLLSQSGTESSAYPSFSQSLISIKFFGHGFPLYLAFCKTLLIFTTGTIVEITVQ